MKKIIGGFIVAVSIMVLPGTLDAQAPNRLWTSLHNNPSGTDDRAQGCAVDDGGYLYVTGISYNSVNRAFQTVKYNAATGAKVWSRLYNNPL